MRAWVTLRVLATPLAVGAALLALEVAARGAQFGVDALLHPARYSPRKLGLTDLLEPRADRTGPRLRPDLDTWFQGTRFRSNRLGFRGPEVRVDKPDGTVRVAVLGRSVTMGQGVALEDAWPAQLEALLDRDAGAAGPRYEVLNFAVTGQDLSTMVPLYEERLRDFAPDLVLLSLVPRELRAGLDARTGHRIRSPRRLRLRDWLVDSFAYAGLRKAFASLAPEAVRRPDRAAAIRPERGWRVGPVAAPARPAPAPDCAPPGGESLLESFAARRAEEGVRVVALLLPLERLAGGLGGDDPCAGPPPRSAAVLDLREELGRPPLEAIYYGDDHPDATTHGRYARAVRDALNGLLPAGPRARDPAP